MAARRRVVVTGMGLATPLGIDVEDNWRKIFAGISGIGRLSLPGTEKSPVRAVGEVKADDLERIRREFPGRADSEGEKRTLFALWAARSAMKDAGLDDYKGCRERFGVSLAAGLGINSLDDIHRWITADRAFDYSGFAAQCHRVSRESILRNSSSRAASLVATECCCRGPNLTVTTACASATQAIGMAARMVERGEADVMLAGGADSMLNPVGLVFFVLLGSASLHGGDPVEACRPFDRKRSGLVMGEGAGIVVLEEESHAVGKGARIFAEVAGYGSSMDAYRLTAPEPEGRGAEQSMRRALEDAELPPDGIDYINAHGTSTKLNDLAETLAIKRLFGDHARRLSVSSSKSLIGHLLAASGGPEFIYTVLSVNRDEIHPTVNLVNRDAKCDLDYVPNVGRAKTVRAALSNSFGFGGQNASIVVKKYRG